MHRIILAWGLFFLVVAVRRLSQIFKIAAVLGSLCIASSYAQQINDNASQTVTKMAKQGLKNLRIGVTTSQYDNIPSVLRALGIPFHFTRNSVQPLKDFHVIFIGCTTSEVFRPAQIRTFVERGGVLYVSDLSFYVLQRAFPEMVAKWVNDGPVGILNCQVVDPGLSKTLGNWVALNFNAPSWAYPMQLNNEVDVLISYGAPKGTIAVALTFTFGDGKVIYTSFHNHANTNKIEQALIANLVATPISEAKQIQEREPQASKQEKERQAKPQTKVEVEQEVKVNKYPQLRRAPSPKK